MIFLVIEWQTFYFANITIYFFIHKKDYDGNCKCPSHISLIDGLCVIKIIVFSGNSAKSRE